MMIVFRINCKDGDVEHWPSNDLEIDETGQLKHADANWNIEEYRLSLKQATNQDAVRDFRANL